MFKCTTKGFEYLGQAVVIWILLPGFPHTLLAMVEKAWHSIAPCKSMEKGQSLTGIKTNGSSKYIDNVDLQTRTHANLRENSTGWTFELTVMMISQTKQQNICIRWINNNNVKNSSFWYTDQMSYHTNISFFIFIPVYPLMKTSCVFMIASWYITTSTWVAEEWRSINLSARYWYSVSLLELFLMKSFWKFEGISSWSLIPPNIVPSLPRASQVQSFKLLLKYLSVMKSTRMHTAIVFDILD